MTSILFAAIFYMLGINWVGTLSLIFAFIGLLNLIFLSRLAMWFQKTFLGRLENLYYKIHQFALKG